MPSGRTNNFPESGRGLGHVTPTIFGSTVGYPSDSLASCLRLLSAAVHQRAVFTFARWRLRGGCNSPRDFLGRLPVLLF